MLKKVIQFYCLVSCLIYLGSCVWQIVVVYHGIVDYFMPELICAEKIAPYGNNASYLAKMKTNYNAESVIYKKWNALNEEQLTKQRLDSKASFEKALLYKTKIAVYADIILELPSLLINIIMLILSIWIYRKANNNSWKILNGDLDTQH